MSDFDADANDRTAALAPDTAAVEQLGLPEIEEAIGEIERRISVALRALGERAADEPDASGRSPRLETAELATNLELSALALAAAADGDVLAGEPPDRHEVYAGGLMYAAPTIPALLQRLDQDRRLLVSLARAAEERAAPGAGARLLVQHGLGAAARCAMALEAALERHAAAGHAGEPDADPLAEP